ncbi:Lrp/AsnC family transcriptional regulator [Candidatus Woesearchaeota archaeon]|nr:Lrp/AsnC family transcriptional regulator [Candidatus Woesearchaeota archaeon]
MQVKMLRPVEKRVLAQLELDARTPFSAIGKRLRKSQQQVSYTVNALVEKGAIQSFYSVIDYTRLDLMHFRVYFRVTYVSEEKFEELVSYLIHDTHTCWISTCGGSYDLICTFLSPNPSKFNKILRAVMERFPDQLGNYSVLTTVVNRHVGRKYLFHNHAPVKLIIFGGDRIPMLVDELDLRLLDLVSTDARRSAVRMAAELGVTPKTVIGRLKRLQERQIILGFKPLLDPERIGYTANLLLVRYHNISAEMEKKLTGFLKEHPNVVSAVKTLGEWDLEIEIEVDEPRKLRAIEIEIRQRFATLIQGIESVPLYHCFKKEYFPRYILEESEKTAQQPSSSSSSL